MGSGGDASREGRGVRSGWAAASVQGRREMTDLRLHHSNRMEALAAELARIMRADPGDPFEPERIVVPHPTVGRWLALELARELGIAANLRFEQPAEFAWSIMRCVVPDLSAEQPYAPARLRWRILDLLPDGADTAAPGASTAHRTGDPQGTEEPDRGTRAWQGALQGYLRDGDARKRLELADRLARVYDRCLNYRPDWIREWEGGAAPHWQARLWQCLVETDGPGGTQHWVRALDEFGQAFRSTHGARDAGDSAAVRVSDASLPAEISTPAAVHRPRDAPTPPAGARHPSGWPRRASFFAVQGLSPSYLELLRLAAQGIEIHLFLLNPCREYWGDIHSRREIDYRADGADPDMRYLTEGNELLAAWGRAGRDMFDALVEFPHAEWEEHFVAPAGAHRLAAVQRDILELRLAGGAAEAEWPTISAFGEDSPGAGPVEGPRHSEDSPAPDDSLQIHVCHSPVREAEVLHDRLLALFDEHRDLEPADVLVLTPSLDVYGPAIEAVFAAAGGIPCNVARVRAAGSRTMRAFLDLLCLPGSRHGAEAVLAPLAAPAVAARFGVGEADLPGIRDMVRDAGIRWGVDAAHRGEEGLPATADHTWRHGLRRLLLGYAMPGADALVGGIVPCPSDGERFAGREIDAEMLGRFVSYCEEVFGLRDRLGGMRPPAQWGQVLRDVIHRFFDDGSQSTRGAGGSGGGPAAGELAADVGDVRALVRDFERESARAEVPVPFEVVLDVLRENVRATAGGTTRLADAVTVASLGPGRIVPAGVVCTVGMNDGVFPRSPPEPSFDLVAAGRARRGDREARYEDRYAFLEALLAARRCFIVTYAGRGLRDDAPVPPSVLVDELKDYLGRRFPGAAIETRHPLQPFSPRYFEAQSAGAELFSYSRGMCEAARTMRADRARDASRPRFAGVDLAEPDASRRSVDLAELAAFFANPTRFLLRDRLGVRLELDDLALDEDEPFELDDLERYHLRSDVWERMRAGVEPQRAAALLHGSGRLPQAGLGRIVYERALLEVEPLEEQLAPHRRALDAPACEIDFELAGFRIVGAVTHVDRAELNRSETDGINPGDAGDDGAGLDRMVWWRIGGLRARDRIDIRLRQLAWAAAGCGPLEAIVIWRKDDVWRTAAFPPPEDAHEELRRWLGARWRGLATPLPFFPETSLAFANAVANFGDDVEAGLEAARAKALDVWDGDPFRRGERLDPYLGLVHDVGDPLADWFEDLATELLVPLAESQP